MDKRDQIIKTLCLGEIVYDTPNPKPTDPPTEEYVRRIYSIMQIWNVDSFEAESCLDDAIKCLALAQNKITVTIGNPSDQLTIRGLPGFIRDNN